MSWPYKAYIGIKQNTILLYLEKTLNKFINAKSKTVKKPGQNYITDKNI